MTAKEKLREVVNHLSERDAEAALHFIDERRERGDDVVAAILDDAPIDDERATPEEEAGVAEARDEYEHGDVFEADEIKRELG